MTRNVRGSKRRDVDVNTSMSARERISRLTPAQKGSLGESFFLQVLCPKAKRISHTGVRADVELPDGTRVDLKLHRSPPVNKSKVEWYWLDYLSPAAGRAGRSTIWRLVRGHPNAPAGYEFSNEAFETHFAEWSKGRVRSRLGPKSESANAAKQAAIAKAQAKIRRLHPQFPSLRFLVRQASAAGRLTVAPSIYSHNAITKAPDGVTIVLIGDDDWTAVGEYWVFKHNTPLASIRSCVEWVGDERPDIGWRFKQGAFPGKWRFKL